MKTALLSVLVVVGLLGCSKENARESAPPVSPAPANAGVIAPHITYLDCPETQELNQIKSQALALLQKKNYAELEALAQKYRKSKERYADGIWKLAAVYNGLEPAGDSLAADWRARIEQINDWAKVRPESAMPGITLARILTSYAWAARGGAYANEVNAKSMELFFTRLKQALGYLEASRSKEKCPVYWSSLQLVALGLQFEKEKYNAIFAEATKEYPDYVYYYTQRATYLLPRWYGAEGEWQKDLAESADRIGGEAGDVLFTQVAWGNNHYGISGNIVRNTPGAWERVDRGFGFILKQFPDSLAAKSGRAYMAAMAGDKGKARRYFLETKGMVDLCHWDDKEQFEKFLSWTFSP